MYARQYFLMRPKYVLHDMYLSCLTQLYAPNRHINGRFWRNSKFWKINFCAFWVQLRFFKLRRQKSTISGDTYFDLVQKYWKFASVNHFEVWSYLWILQKISQVQKVFKTEPSYLSRELIVYIRGGMETNNKKIQEGHGFRPT